MSPQVIVIDQAMIAAAAEAIRDAGLNRYKKGKPWSRLPDNVKAVYLREAEAALRAGLAAASTLKEAS
jgi:basic membrane lipoprotein Med (substrate-binding protein (PBP1-ABC) superfamily)